MSGLVNKVKEALHSDKSSSHHDSTTSHHDTTGTHGSGAGIDNRGAHGPAPGTDGPHGSNMMNKTDPRVDSDRDHSHNLGANSSGNARTDNVHSGPGAGGLHGTTGTHGTHGTHGSAAGLDNRGVGGNTHTDTLHSGSGAGVGGMHGTPGAHHTTGTHGTHGTTGAHGVHDNTGAYSASGPGPAPGTAGPHKSDVLNKADPRVDSNLDGSKTVGGNKTFDQSNAAHKDPTDASQVPPSVLQKTKGDPEVHHDDPRHSTERRHGSISHQEHGHGL